MKKQFIGTWKLVSSEFHHSSGEIAYPLGKNALGMIIYDAYGNMSTQLMNPDRPPFKSNNQFAGSASEIQAAFEGYVAYFGSYEVHEDEGTVVHRVKGSMFPNWMGTEQKRFFQFEGNRLVLRTPLIPVRDGHQTGMMTWERSDT